MLAQISPNSAGSSSLYLYYNTNSPEFIMSLKGLQDYYFYIFGLATIIAMVIFFWISGLVVSEGKDKG